MASAYDIPDSTDWLGTPLQSFSDVENALHCQICKEFYDTPMITSCAHTFCSKCIRTSLSTDGRCPACRATDQASKLRNNWALQELVSTFLAARPAALDVARKERDRLEQIKKGGKRKRTVLDSDDLAQAEQDGRTTRSKSRKLAASQTSQPESIEIEDSDGESNYDPRPLLDDGLVDCPLGCGKRMKIEAVEPHLDRCEDERKQPNRSKSRTSLTINGGPLPSSSQAAKPQERISELSYSLLTETKLSRKLTDLGIPAWGPKPLLTKRHTEWVNLWNANCDSSRPHSKRELLHELDVWERTQGGRAPNVNGLANGIMKKDFDGEGWASKNRDDFSRLIAEARAEKSSPASEIERDEGESVPHDSNAPQEILANDEPRGNEDIELNKPYEKNEEAINSVRQEVETANGGPNGFTAPHSSSNEISIPANGMPVPAISSPYWGQPDKTSSEPENTALLEQAHFGIREENRRHQRVGNGPTVEPCDLPNHLHPSPVKKMPMFTMPHMSVADVDAGAGAGKVEQ